MDKNYLGEMPAMLRDGFHKKYSQLSTLGGLKRPPTCKVILFTIGLFCSLLSNQLPFDLIIFYRKILLKKNIPFNLFFVLICLDICLTLQNVF